MKKRGRRGFDEQFRREAVRLAESGTMPIAEVARQLGVHLETLRNWRRKARDAGGVESVTTVPSLEEENRPAAARERAAARGARDLKKRFFMEFRGMPRGF
jgi:transposase